MGRFGRRHVVTWPADLFFVSQHVVARVSQHVTVRVSCSAFLRGGGFGVGRGVRAGGCRAGGQRATAWFLEMDLSTPGKLIQPSQLVLSGLGPLLPIPCLPAHTITTASARTPTHSRMHARKHTRRAHPPAYSVYCITLFDGPSVLSTHMSAAFWKPWHPLPEKPTNSGKTLLPHVASLPPAQPDALPAPGNTSTTRISMRLSSSTLWSSSLRVFISPAASTLPSYLDHFQPCLPLKCNFWILEKREGRPPIVGPYRPTARNHVKYLRAGPAEIPF